MQANVKRMWVCINQRSAFEYLSSLGFPGPATLETVSNLMLEMQSRFADTQTCANRTSKRCPESIRMQLRLAKDQSSDFERLRLERVALASLRLITRVKRV